METKDRNTRVKRLHTVPLMLLRNLEIQHPELMTTCFQTRKEETEETRNSCIHCLHRRRSEFESVVPVGIEMLKFEAKREILQKSGKTGGLQLPEPPAPPPMA